MTEFYETHSYSNPLTHEKAVAAKTEEIVDMSETTNTTKNSTLDAILAQSVTPWQLENIKFADDPEANHLIKENLTAFLIAASLDRGGKSFQIFNIPFKLQQQWGHLDTKLIREMDAEQLAIDPILVNVASSVSRKHLARTVVSVAQVIENDFGGDPLRMFQGNVDDVMTNLRRIFGVGPGIARMIVIQRLLYFGFQPLEGGTLLPKLDTHIKCVFKRTGLMAEPTEAQLKYAVRGYSNREVAIIDQEAWRLGATYCHATSPNCAECPILASCPKVGV